MDESMNDIDMLQMSDLCCSMVVGQYMATMCIKCEDNVPPVVVLPEKNFVEIALSTLVPVLVNAHHG